MLTEIYIEALLVDEELADQVWELWDKGEIDDQTGFIAWMLISGAIAAEIIPLWSGFPVLVQRRTVDTLEGIRIGFDPALIDRHAAIDTDTELTRLHPR
jgi:hypothetical protein